MSARVRLALALALGTVLVAIAFTASVAQAAAPSPCGGVPQIADGSGDGHHPSSDVLSAWFSEESGHLQAVIKVRSGTWEPEHDDAEVKGSGFALLFSVGGQTAYVRANVPFPAEGPITYDYGTYAPVGNFASAGPTGGEIVKAAQGGTVTIDVPTATGAAAGALLAGPYVLTYDGTNGGVHDWVDQAPGGTSPTDPARGADYVVGSCVSGGGGGTVSAGSGQTVAVQLKAPARLKGGGKARISGKVVPARAGVTVELTRTGAGRASSSLTTAADGSFATTLPVSETTRLRAVAEGIASSTLTVAVGSEVRLELRRRPSGAIRLLGRLRPALPGRLLLLGADDVSATATRMAGKRRFAFRFGAGKLAPGRYQVVYIPARGRAERSTSNTVLIR